MSKALSTLKQFVRDWSEEGTEERALCYGPVFQALDSLFGELSAEEKYHRHPPFLSFRSNTRILVPGVGLGRILYELAKKGYEAQGNELEFCMLMASNLALNLCVPLAS
jgi:carnosine N-methyltransferase